MTSTLSTRPIESEFTNLVTVQEANGFLYKLYSKDTALSVLGIPGYVYQLKKTTLTNKKLKTFPLFEHDQYIVLDHLYVYGDYLYLIFSFDSISKKYIGYTIHLETDTVSSSVHDSLNIMNNSDFKLYLIFPKKSFVIRDNRNRYSIASHFNLITKTIFQSTNNHIYACGYSNHGIIVYDYSLCIGLSSRVLYNKQNFIYSNITCTFFGDNILVFNKRNISFIILSGPKRERVIIYTSQTDIFPRNFQYNMYLLEYNIYQMVWTVNVWITGDGTDNVIKRPIQLKARLENDIVCFMKDMFGDIVVSNILHFYGL